MEFYRKLTPTKIIILGYLAIILTGAFLLTLPFSARSGQSTPFINALLTATSATCVTGLVVYDTYTYWTTFGQGVILFLIQIGGLGFLTMGVMVSIVTRRRIGLRQRISMQESISVPQTGGIVRLTRFVFSVTMLLEGIGAILLAFRFSPRMGLGKGIYFGLFHSISAFCNAGFDLMGEKTPFSSLSSYINDPVVNIVIMMLIVIGGLGFFVWEDLCRNRWHIKKYRLQTKVVLSTTAILIFVGAGLLFMLEVNGSAYAGMSMWEKVIASFFQAITPRTAGYNTVPIASLTQTSLQLIIILMIIGGSPGSTAGGIKTTTLALAFFCVRSTFKKEQSLQCFHRRVSNETVKNAFTILLLYLFLFISGAMVISTIESLPILSTLFETASAIATVGLTMGITPGLCSISKLVLIFLMYFGRVGCLTIIFAFYDNHAAVPSQMPLENIAVG